MTIGIQALFSLPIQGENLDSVLVNEIRVTVGGVMCVITTVQTSSGLVCDFQSSIPACINCSVLKMQLYCTPPATPPEGVTIATVKVYTIKQVVLGLFYVHFILIRSSQQYLNFTT